MEKMAKILFQQSCPGVKMYNLLHSNTKNPSRKTYPMGKGLISVEFFTIFTSHATLLASCSLSFTLIPLHRRGFRLTTKKLPLRQFLSFLSRPYDNQGKNVLWKSCLLWKCIDIPPKTTLTRLNNWTVISFFFYTLIPIYWKMCNLLYFNI